MTNQTLSTHADWSVLGAQSFEQAAQTISSLSPYLSALLTEHGAWLADNLDTYSALVWQRLCSDAAECAKSENVDAAMSGLRRAKRRAHLYCALMDLSRVWDWADATQHLTDFADSALSAAFQFSARHAGIIDTPDDIAPGIFALALGKYGGGELNYSSDIDFIIFFDPSKVVLPPGRTAERQIIKLVQKTVKIIGEINAQGYVFRTDLRLRPDPRSTSVAVSTTSAERYYEALGQNWERAAMIKARPCAGDLESGQRFIAEVLSPYIWRRSLDFAAIDDIQAMARQLQAVGERAKIKAADHNIKLGRGGIRAIEFYVQTQQLILGGRRKELRQPRTVDMLGKLSEAGYIEPKIADMMAQAYAFFRDIEHRIQMIDDAQTHILPADEQARTAIARLSGFDKLEAFDAALIEKLEQVHNAYSDLYSGTESLATPEGALMFTGVEPEAETLATLRKMGFVRAEDVWKTMADWLGGRIMATRHERARETLTALAPHILISCQKTGDADTAFFRFADFFAKLRTGVSFLAYLKAQPDVLDFVMEIAGIAPYLSDTLTRRTEILDALIEPQFFKAPLSGIGQEYDAFDAGDIEGAMDHVRRRVREDRFRIGSALLRGVITPDQCACGFTDTADYAVGALIAPAIGVAERRHKAPLNAEIAVLALGKMGSREMSMQSDLDLMVLYDSIASDAPGAGRHEIVATFTKRFINFLSAVTSEGPLFEVDMALRPSGGSGPITVSREAFIKYYANDAWTWEFMALSRARIIYASSEDFAARLERDIEKIVGSVHARHNVTADVRDMRDRLLSEKPPRGFWDIKSKRGGLTDAEFILQNEVLLQASSVGHNLGQTSQNTLAGLANLDGQTREALQNAFQAYHDLRQILGLCWSGIYDPERAPAALQRHICQTFNVESPEEVIAILQNIETDIARIFKARIGRSA